MDVQVLKDHILENQLVEHILDNIGCTYIQYHNFSSADNYYTCANLHGDNKSAITLYENENLTCVNYTRTMNPKKENTDIFDLVMYNKKFNFFEALNYTCQLCGLDYYSLENEDDLPESIKLTMMLLKMNGNTSDNEEEDCRLQPKNEAILSYYKPHVNDMFYNDNISYEVQKYFEIGYDQETNCITIPIRDELGNFIGVKGRKFEKDIVKNKYVYLERCSKGKILFGLNKSYNAIQKEGYVIVVESEKAVMQLFNMGYENCVAIGGKKPTSYQRNKLLSLGVQIVFALDKDVSYKDIADIVFNMPDELTFYAIIDSDNILDEKESPTDKKDKWKYLFENNIVKVNI